MRMILVDVCREHTIFHRIDIENGKYERPFYMKGKYMTDMVTDFIALLWKDRPNKVVIDHNGLGKGFIDMLEHHLWNDKYMHIDAKGNITYNGEHLNGKEN